ncbi:Interferon-induced transmembrane protein [Nonlabens sp. YIK11]|uniref:CCC motif membrane protein n=1 Tax=Nonlabens sp. YIK11 TaxID=1453349 RepID=UPI0006DBD7F7|nr:CCC motif membrane protein [Nonlabens sp. YIK11]KQC34242.1 Interferon-induced transmembrane protein [Nonlabens sp. YIK11]
MQKLNTTVVYILSIVGFLCCCFYGIGFIASIIAFVIATKELKKYAENPEAYSNGKAMKTAKTVALVALILSGIMAAYTAYQYIVLSEEERLEQTLDTMESLGVPQDIIDQTRAQAEADMD